MNPRNGFYWLLALIIALLNHPLDCLSKARESQLRVGKAINIFVRYGYLGISMRVIPNNDSYERDTWLFREPTRNVFQDLSNLTENVEQNTPGVFNGDFHLEFCDNRRQLFQAYFRDFSVERMEKPWEAFTAGWVSDNAAKKLGINTSFIAGDYSYVLVRVVRFRETGKLKSEIPLDEPLENDVINGMEELNVGNVSTTVKFMDTVGTHYINSYTTGNSIFQVFVYNRKNYQMIKERIKSKGINDLSKHDLTNFFAPWYAEHLGKIRSASSNGTVERWARRKLQHEYYYVKYVTLLKLHGNGTLLRTLDGLLGNEAILQLDLKCLTSIFKRSSDKEKWFHEVLDNQLRLWETNLPYYVT